MRVALPIVSWIAAMCVPLAAAAQQAVDLGTARIPQWTPAPAVQIGGDRSPDVTLSRPRIVGLRSDGQVVVIDAAVPEVLIFLQNGRLVRRFGRNGDGPGEFRFIGGAGLHADSLWVWDSRSWRLSLFDPSGRLAHDKVMPPLLGIGDRGTLVSIIGMRDKRELLVIRDPPGIEKQGGAFTRLTLRVDSAGVKVLDTVARSEIAEAFASSPGAMFMLPFAPIADGPLQAIGADRRVTVLRRAARQAGRGEFVVRLEVATRVVQETRFSYTPLATPKDSLRQQLGAVITNERRRAAAARALDMPDYLPPVTAVHVDERGMVWLRREDFQRGGFEWMVLDPDLRPLGTFRMASPANSAQYPLNGFFWAHEEDERGEPRVVGYAFPVARPSR